MMSDNSNFKFELAVKELKKDEATIVFWHHNNYTTPDLENRYAEVRMWLRSTLMDSCLYVDYFSSDMSRIRNKEFELNDKDKAIALFMKGIE